MQYFYTAILIVLTFLVGFQLRDGLRKFSSWVAPVFPLADSRLKQKLREWSLDIALAAVLSYIAVTIYLSSDLFGRLAGP